MEQRVGRTADDAEHVDEAGPATGHELRRLLGIDALGRHGDRAALHVGERTVSYARLAELVDERRQQLGVGRRLVAIRGSNHLDVVITFLACVEGRHPMVMIERDEEMAGIADYRPDVLVRCGDVTPVVARLDHRTPAGVSSPHRLHEELAVLARTSGSTGTTKLVRLSAAGVAANASSIATYLGLSKRDCGVTSLPLSYCYGLSVLTSHLVVGAAVVLTDGSVVDPCFRSALNRHGVTGLAGVPYTFDLLERGGSDVFDTPTLRYITQAGGRLEPARVASLAELGRSCGWDFFVMYGQTEATARIAYLPPDDAFAHPECVGIAIPGGSVSIDTVTHTGAQASTLTGAHVDTRTATAGGVDDVQVRASDVGEIVYRGPNVMMGYAQCPADLARGPELTELRTGDLGRINADGLLEIVGRVNRFVKIHGKRIDLDHLESTLRATGLDVRCAGDDELLAVAVARHGSAGPTAVVDDELTRLSSDAVSIPVGRIAAISVRDFRRTPSGKIDHAALLAIARDTASTSRPLTDARTSVSAAFELVLGVDRVDPGDTFARLGGDSFSYVEMSIRLEAIIGSLPADWHLLPVAELDELARAGRRRRFVTQLETSVVIRAIAICLIVCTHMRIFRVAGGAHALLAVLGFNFARFQLTASEVPGRLRSAAATIARVAVPTSLWIGLNAVLFGGYSLGAALLVNNYTGAAARRDGRWEYWYFEAFVQVMLVLVIVFSFGAVRRAERRAPFVFALAALALTWFFRFQIVELGGRYNYMFRTHTIVAFVALGWLAYRSRTALQRTIATAATVITTVGFFEQTDRELRIVLMVAALIWIPRISMPTPVARIVGVLAAASMWIFLVHWQIWPLFTPWLDDRVAYILTLGSGVLVWFGVRLVSQRVAALRRGQRRRLTVGRSTRSQVNTPDIAISVSEARPVRA